MILIDQKFEQEEQNELFEDLNIVKKIIQFDDKSIKQMFIKSDEKVLTKQNYPEIQVPIDYDPYNKVREALQNTNQSKKNLNFHQYSQLDHTKRSEILGETISNNQKQAVMDFDPKIKEKMMNVKQFVKAQDQEMQQQSDEKKEALLIKIEELKAQIELDKKKRQRVIWTPSGLLCKRFGLNPPHRGKYIKPEENITRGDRFENEVLPLYYANQKKLKQKEAQENNDSNNNQEQANSSNYIPNLGNKFVSSAVYKNDQQIENDKQIIEDQEVQEAQDKPNLSLFKSIFDNDSDEEDSH